MNFALRYGDIRTRVGAIPDLQRPLASTTRPLVYIRLVPDSFPLYVMENHAVPVVYTRVAEWLRPRAFGDRGLLPRGSKSFRISMQNSSFWRLCWFEDEGVQKVQLVHSIQKNSIYRYMYTNIYIYMYRYIYIYIYI